MVSQIHPRIFLLRNGVGVVHSICFSRILTLHLNCQEVSQELNDGAKDAFGNDWAMMAYFGLF